jgi:hypothetical protein
MVDEERKALEMRIVELENQLKELAARPRMADISKDEFEAYLKVRGVLEYEPRDCGINDCQPCEIFRCSFCAVCQLCTPPCVNECTCGPCNMGRFQQGPSRRFGRLGR